MVTGQVLAVNPAHPARHTIKNTEARFHPGLAPGCMMSIGMIFAMHLYRKPEEMPGSGVGAAASYPRVHSWHNGVVHDHDTMGNFGRKGALMAVAVTACVVASGDHPPYVPTRDVVVVYRMVSDTGIGGIPVPQWYRISFAYSSQSGRMRVDTGEDDYTIIDRGADRAVCGIASARRAVRVQRAVSIRHAGVP